MLAYLSVTCLHVKYDEERGVKEAVSFLLEIVTFFQQSEG